MASLSIVIPNYNHARHLPLTLAAALEQSRPADEIIVIDDGSTDDSIAVVREIARRSPTLRLLENPRNLGVVATLNRGIAEARGEYVTFPGADDRLLPGFNENLMALLERHPEAGIAWAECGWFDGEEIKTNPRASARMPDYLSGRDFYETVRKRRYFLIATSSVVYKKSSLIEAGGYLPELGYLADWFNHLVIAFRHGICYTSETLSAFRIIPGSFHSTDMKNHRRAVGIMRAVFDTLDDHRYHDVREQFYTTSLLAHIGFPALAGLRERRTSASAEPARRLRFLIPLYWLRSTSVAYCALAKRRAFVVLRRAAPPLLRRLYRIVKPAR